MIYIWNKTTFYLCYYFSAPGKPGSAMASLAKAGVAGTSAVQVVLKDSPVFLAQASIFRHDGRGFN